MALLYDDASVKPVNASRSFTLFPLKQIEPNKIFLNNLIWYQNSLLINFSDQLKTLFLITGIVEINN